MTSDHARLLEAVARHFFGEPNQRLSRKGELRFGTHGSLSIDLEKAAWFDHEANEGGGPLDLIKRETGISEPRDCYAWAEREGYWNGHPRPKPRGEPIAVYGYTDETGELRSAAILGTVSSSVGRTAAAAGFTASKACGWCRIGCRR